MIHQRYIYRKLLWKALFEVADFIFYPLYWAFGFKEKTEIRKKKIKNVLVARFDHIGDFIMTLPLFYELKRLFPESKLNFLGGNWTFEIASMSGLFHEIICVDASWQSMEKRFSASHFMEIVNTVKKGGFDLFIDAKGDPVAILIGFLSGIKLRLGFGVAGLGFMLNRNVDYNYDRNMAENYLEVAGLFTGEVKNRKPFLPEKIIDSDYVEANVRRAGGKLIGVHIGTGNPDKNWDPEKFKGLVSALKDRYAAGIVITGGKTDFGLGEEMRHIAPDVTVNLCGKTNVRQWISVISTCNIFVSLDSASAHICSCFEIPLVVLHGLRETAKNYHPYMRNYVSITKDVKEDLDWSGRIRKAMGSISVDDVMKEVEKIRI